MQMIIQREEYERLKEVERQFQDQMSLIEVLNGSVITLRSRIEEAHETLRSVCRPHRAIPDRGAND